MATFTVTTRTDSVNATDGKLSLREALAQANATAAADTITFAAGLEGKTIALTKGQLDIASDVTISGDPDRDGLGITLDQRTDRNDADAPVHARVLAIAAGSDAILKNLTITGGYTDQGSGILAGNDVDLSLVQCAVVNNRAGIYGYEGRGGGIRIDGGTLSIAQSTIAGNTASGGEQPAYGGGIYAGSYDGRVAVAIDSSTITANDASGRFGGIGGGILLHEGSSLALASSIIDGNRGWDPDNETPTDADIAGRITSSDGCSVLGSVTAAPPGGDLADVDPALVFASLDSGGGHLVLDNGTWVAPLRDASNNPALAAADPSTSGIMDQRGATRPAPAGTLPDVGAFELAQHAPSNHATPGNDWIVGTLGPDTIDALSGNDVVRGLAGNDTLYGRLGNDVLYGGIGDDRLSGGTGADWFDGGPGNDQLLGGADSDTVSYANTLGAVRVSLALTNPQSTGGSGTDTIQGVENLVGSRYDDHLAGSGVANVIDGGDGNDEIAGAGAVDTLHGGAGDDTLIGGPGNDILNGQDGQDIASYADASAAVTVRLATGNATGGGGSDRLYSVEGAIGSAFADTLRGDAETNSLEGGPGDDLIDGGAQSAWRGDIASYAHAFAAVSVSLAVAGPQDTGAAGRDTLVGMEGLAGSAFADRLTGGTGDNDLFGAAGNDTLRGGTGDDTIWGEDGNDLLIGDAGNDGLLGGAGVDTVSYADATGSVTVDRMSEVAGAAGTDWLYGVENVIGSRFADSLRGDDVVNRISGGAGNDVLYGDPDWGEAWSADTLTGGAGADLFAYGRWEQSTPTARDTITDFEGAGATPGDRIDLAAVYAGTLAFRGTGAFTAVGQVHVTANGADTLIEVNLSGDTAPEMAILAQDGAATAGQWVAGDFVL